MDGAGEGTVAAAGKVGKRVGACNRFLTCLDGDEAASPPSRATRLDAKTSSIEVVHIILDAFLCVCSCSVDSESSRASDLDA